MARLGSSDPQRVAGNGPWCSGLFQVLGLGNQERMAMVLGKSGHESELFPGIQKGSGPRLVPPHGVYLKAQVR